MRGVPSEMRNLVTIDKLSPLTASSKSLAVAALGVCYKAEDVNSGV